jgi:hypothetical protein
MDADWLWRNGSRSLAGRATHGQTHKHQKRLTGWSLRAGSWSMAVATGTSGRACALGFEDLQAYL